MHRYLAALIAAVALACTAASACALGRDPSKISQPAGAYDAAEGALPIVAAGTNAPEALLHVYAARPVRNGIETVYAFAGPCRSQAFRKVFLSVRTEKPLAPGDLFYHVSTSLTAEHPWALRRATEAEQRKFRSCRWD